jgi:hypothetical protein
LPEEELMEVYFMEVELIPLIPCKWGMKKSVICLTKFEEGEQIRKLSQTHSAS